MNSTPLLLAALGAATVLPPAARAGWNLRQIDVHLGPIPSSEIVAHDASNDLLYNTYGELGAAGVELVHFANPRNTSSAGTIPMNTVDGLKVRSVSSVAADPLGRGFGVAAVIPEDSGAEEGRLVFFDPATRSVLRTVKVGYHPDSVKFSADGTQVFVVNEGEPVSLNGVHDDRPGSLSVIDLAGIASVGDIGALPQANVATYDFSASNLAAGVTLDGLRVHPTNTSADGRIKDAEPEFVSQAGSKLYVTMQENNAVAEFDLAAGKWTAVHPLGTIQQTIDASSADGIKIDDVVKGLPMPDGIGTVTANGKTYFVTANEGDARPADNVATGHPQRATDEARFQQLGTGGRPALDPAVDQALDALYDGNAQADTALGRLRVSLIDGDTDGDGDIDEPTMFGTRSFTIWDAETGALVFDSGSAFEEITGYLVPGLYNSNGAGPADTRSQNKGPEPEGIAIGEAFGRTLAFIGLERTGGIMVYDITDPLHPFFADYVNTGELAPEGIDFVPASSSPTGLPLLLVGFEVSNKVGVYQWMMPDTGSSLAMMGGGLMGLLLLARRRSGGVAAC